MPPTARPDRAAEVTAHIETRMAEANRRLDEIEAKLKQFLKAQAERST